MKVDIYCPVCRRKTDDELIYIVSKEIFCKNKIVNHCKKCNKKWDIREA